MRLLFTLILLFHAIFSISQNNQAKFNETSEKIETLLKYKDKSPSQLRSLLKELESYSFNNPNEFNHIKKRVDSYLLPLEIRLIRSDVYNRKYRNAVDLTKQIKMNYSYSSEIQKLDKYLDRKLYSYHKNLMIHQKSSWFSLEPSLSCFTQERLLNDITETTEISNLNPVYGLGFYVKFNKKKKENSGRIARYSFSQIGLKLDYRDNGYILLKDSAYVAVDPYINSQISFLYRKTLGLDAGVLQYVNSLGNVKTNYSLTASFFIPIRFVSLGAHARIISDLTSNQPSVQFGASLKFNLGIYKPYSLRDKEEVKSQAFKFKENK